MANPVLKLVRDNTHAIPREQQLSYILSLTIEMYERATRNDWDAVIRLESQRTVLIADYFSSPVSDQEVPAVAGNITKVLEIDKRLIELGDNECHQLRENLQKISRGKHALKVYTTG
ncbi:MAG TPA: flagellar protein FliT [Gammaproteobacteria bacterium]